MLAVPHQGLAHAWHTPLPRQAEVQRECRERRTHWCRGHTPGSRRRLGLVNVE